MKPTEKYHNRLKELEQIRDYDKTRWSNIQDYVLPSHGQFLSWSQNPQDKKDRTRIYDGTATLALRILAAGMQGGLTSPARPWFRLGLTEPDLMEYGPVREYLDMVERRMYWVLGNSNFYTSVHSVYTDLGSFGSACLYEEEDEEQIIRFRLIQAGEYLWAEGARGLVNTLYRRFYRTAGQLAERFGREKLSREIKEVLDKNPDQQFQVVQAVQPRKSADQSKKDNQNMSVESVYFEYGQDEFINKSGYHEFPFFCPRWYSGAGDAYGFSPCHDLMSDIKMLQEMQKSVLIMVHKQVDPPVMIPSEMKHMPVNLLPGGRNYGDMDKGIRPVYEVRPNLQDAEYKIGQIREQIREGLFNNMFLMVLERPNMTATEVAERHEEKLLMLGPVIERQFNELLDPVIDRTFGILNRAGYLPAPPPEIQGMDLKVEYISLLAQAQKMVGTQSIRSTADFVGGLSQFWPEAADKFDPDEAIDQYAEMTGAPTRIVRTDDEVAKIRALRAERQAMMEEQERRRQMAEEEMQGVAAAKTLSETQTKGDNALAEILGSLY